MKRRALLLLGVCCCLPAAAPAGVHIAIRNGRKVIFNDGVGSRPREALSRSDTWLAARVAIPSLYDGEISRAAREAAIDPRLVKSVMLIESAFNPGAVSRKGARGLMQLMPETAVQYGVRNSFDPAQNISGGPGTLPGCSGPSEETCRARSPLTTPGRPLSCGTEACPRTARRGSTSARG